MTIGLKYFKFIIYSYYIMFLNKKYIFILLIIILFILFYFSTKFKYNELFEDKSSLTCESVSDGSLKTYLSSIGKDKDFIKGCPDNFTLPACSVQDPNRNGYQLGKLWHVEYKDKSVDTVCVPNIYSDTNAYIPCNAPNPGPPDLTGCGIPDKDSECIKEMKNVPKYINETDRQQYLYSCKSGICPCMWKYGKDYKINCLPPEIGGCDVTQSKKIQDDEAKKRQEDEAKKRQEDEARKNQDDEARKNQDDEAKKRQDMSIKSYNIFNGLFWLGCTKYNNNITNSVNKKKFNTMCNNAYRGSKYIETDSRGCDQPNNTQIGCSLVSQKRYKE